MKANLKGKIIKGEAAKVFVKIGLAKEIKSNLVSDVANKVVGKSYKKSKKKSKSKKVLS